MTLLFISSLILIVGASASAVWFIHRAYIHTIDGLRADNKDLRDRLFQKNGQPPSGIDLTQKYEVRQEREKEQRETSTREKKPLGPIERLESKWAEDDRRKADKNIDATRSRLLN